MTWPEYFPDNCPPDDCMEATGHIFFFKSTNVENRESFLCHRLRFPNKEHENPCMACGLSVSISEKDAEESRKRVPLLRNKQLLVSSFEDVFGLIKHTPIRNVDKHHTWWFPAEIECPWDFFVCINEY